MPVLFCKYLRNESSDLYEIFYGGQFLCLHEIQNLSSQDSN